LAIEAVAALLAAMAGARVGLVGGAFDWVLTVVWLVVITNSFNLLDNMDGAAGVIATVTAVCLAVAATLQGQWLVGGMAALVAGSCLGFLVYNWHPARIFLGDAGSLFLGYLLAVIALKLRFPVAHGASIPAVLLFAGPALFDTSLVVVSRAMAGTPIYLGGTDHASHRLLALGLGVRTVAMILAAASGLLGVLGLAVGRGALPALAVAPAVSVAGALLLVWFLQQPALTRKLPQGSPPLMPANAVAVDG
jgi:UDP-GlcNAc:undecaprenyl-phosphate GlcNAc-1-phosphate transferase